MFDQLFILFFIALFASLFLTPFVRTYAHKKGFLDDCAEARKIHKKPIPRIGGVALFVGFTLSVGALFFLRLLDVTAYPLAFSDISTIMGLSLCVCFVGLLDDVFNVQSKVKFFSQIGLAVVAYLLGFKIHLVTIPFANQPISLGLLSLPVTILWFVGITNAFNLIDGIDGLSAGLGLIASFVILFVSASTNHFPVALLSAALAGSLLGFLRYNFHPATIFMGDSGSSFIGFMLAALSITGSQKSSTAIVIFIPFLVLAVPILDTVVSVLRRIIAREPIFQADREHIHHKLLDFGLKQNQIAFILYGVAALLGFYSLFFVTPTSRYIGYPLLIIFIFLLLSIQKIGYEEFRELFRLVTVGLRFQGRQLSGQVRLRKLLNGDQNHTHAMSIEELFKQLKSLFKEYGFDSFQLCMNGNGSPYSSKNILSWERENGLVKKNVWKITVPFECGLYETSFFTLSYSNDKYELPIRLSFIIRDLPAMLAESLERCYNINELLVDERMEMEESIPYV